jgi:hypothetical protein
MVSTPRSRAQRRPAPSPARPTALGVPLSHTKQATQIPMLVGLPDFCKSGARTPITAPAKMMPRREAKKRVRRSDTVCISLRNMISTRPWHSSIPSFCSGQVLRTQRGQRKTAASTRQRRQLPQEGYNVQAQGAVTPPPPGVYRLARGRQPAPRVAPQVRRWCNVNTVLLL